jgi:hypothetical protein
MTLTLAMIAIRIPRQPTALDVYAINPPAERGFAAANFDRLAASIGAGRLVEIDIEKMQAPCSLSSS